MVHPFFSLYLTSAILAFEAQQVIVLRCMRLAAGDAFAERELQRMLLEKVEAASQAGLQAIMSLAGGKSSAAITHSTIRRYRTRVRQNRRRLIPK